MDRVCAHISMIMCDLLKQENVVREASDGSRGTGSRKERKIQTQVNTGNTHALKEYGVRRKTCAENY